MKTLEIEGLKFPVKSEEEADFIREECTGKDALGVMTVFVHWLDAVDPSDPTDNLSTVVEAENG